MRFFTSDTHFWHRNIIKYSNRPFVTVEEMNEYIIRKWNEKVGPNDLVFHLGDVALGPWTEWHNTLTRLNGYKVLVVGNHERIFATEKPSQQTRFAPLYAGWFDEVHTNIHDVELADGTVVNLSHFPYDGDHTDRDRYTDQRIPDNGNVLIHGHTHAEYDKHGIASRVSTSKAGTPMIHVGMDAWAYEPVSEDEVINLIHNL